MSENGSLPGGFRARDKLYLIGLLLALLVTALAYVPSVGNSFTTWDDDRYVTANDAIRRLDAGSIRHFFSSFSLGNYHPLTLLSLAVDYRLFGLDPRPYHVENLMLHLLNTFLVFVCVGSLGGGLASLTAAVLFGVHPLHVESVAWVSERKDVLSAFFYLASLAVYVRRPKSERMGRHYWSSLVLFLCALLSKSMAVSLPATMLLTDYLRRRPWRDALPEKVPFLALSALFSGLALVAHTRSGSILAGAEASALDGPFLAAHGILFYLKKTILPTGLSALYPLPAKSGGLLPLPYLLSPLLLGFLGAIAWRAMRRSREVTFGVLFFLVTLLPAMQIVPVGFAFAADRYLYLPSIGLFFLAGRGLERLRDKPGRGQPAAHAFILFALVSAGVTLATLSWRRSLVWKDSVSLWDDAITRYPGVSSYLYFNRGVARGAQGREEEALADYAMALSLPSPDAKAWYNRGTILLDRGEFKRAIADFDAAIAANPGRWEFYLNRGVAHFKEKAYQAAISDYSSVLALNPTHSGAWFNRGQAWEAAGQEDRALSDFQRALQVDPRMDRARSALKRVLTKVDGRQLPPLHGGASH